MDRHVAAVGGTLWLALAVSLTGALAADHAVAQTNASETEQTVERSLDPGWAEAFRWRSIGPATMGGRCIAIAVNENDPSTYWVATASGGLLKTTNAGVTYEHQFQHQNTVSIGHVAVSKSNPDIVWVGTGEANPRNSVSYGDGVYKSTDGGKTWEHMGLEETFQTGRIAIHPENPDIVYVGALGRLWGPNEQRGLFKTTDGGKTWNKVLYIDEKTGVVDVDMHPTDPDTLIVATYERQRDGFDTNDPAKKYGPGSGLWKTTDGGENWTELTEGLPTVNLGRIGVDYYRSDPSILYAMVESERIMKLDPESGFMGISGEDADVGARLTAISPGGPAEAAELKVDDIIIRFGDENIASYEQLTRAIRHRKAGETVTVEFVRDRQFMVAEVTLAEREDPDQAVFSGGLGGQRENVQEEQGIDAFETGGTFRSEDGGMTWTRVNSLNPRPMYYSQIRVDPSDDQRVYVCGTQLYRSEDGGKTFDDDGGRGGVHVDHHALWIDPNDGRHMILGNDGGIYVTYDRMENWDHHNHVAIGQFYHVSADATRDYNVYGGMQDNGSWGGPNLSRDDSGTVNTDWYRVGGGDGFVTLTDPNDPAQVYFESQNGGMGRIHLETGERGFIRPRAPRGRDYRFNWKTPFILSSHNSRIYYAAGNYVFRSLHKGDGMKEISPEITNTDRGAGSAIGESPRDGDVLYVGTTDGALWMTRDGGHEWINLFKLEAGETETPEGDRPESDNGRRIQMINRMLERFDRNGDGKLERNEVTGRMASFFDRFDVNDDDVINQADLIALGGGEPEAEPQAEPPADPVTGEWAARLTGEGVAPEASEFTLHLTLEDDGSVSGSLESPTMKGEGTEGRFDRESGEIEITFREDGSAVTLTGTIENDTMTGVMRVAGGLLRIDFEATRRPPVPVLRLDVEPVHAAADLVTGEWEAELITDPPMGEAGRFTLVLKLGEGGKVTGEASSVQGEAAISSGSYDASTGRIVLTMTADQMVIDLAGIVKDDDSMSGTVSVGDGEFEAEFKARRTSRPEPEQAAEAKAAEQEAREQPETPQQKPAKDDPVSGRWEGEFISDQMPPGAGFEMVLELGEKNAVTGTFSSQFTDADAESGSFNPETGNLEVTFGGEQGDMTIRGKIEGDTLTGQLTAGGGRFTIDVKATRTGAAREPGDEDKEEPVGVTIDKLLPKPMWVSSIEPSKFEDERVYVTIDGHRSDNDEPWVFVSEDYGRHWRSLRANLPRGSSRVIREDLENPNILYLGTEFALWVSVDRGMSWTKLNSNLPTVAIHEIAQHPTSGEIIAGTHGRSIWILDVTPLRQMTESALASPAYLYEPNTVVKWRREPSQGSSGLRRFVGGNPPDDAVIHYSLGREAGSVRLTVEDMEGNELRQLEASNKTGLHTARWDLRPAAEDDGRGRRRRFGRQVDTGTYRVVLVVDGERYSQTFEIVADPKYPELPFDSREAAVEEQLQEPAPEEESEADRPLEVIRD